MHWYFPIFGRYYFNIGSGEKHGSQRFYTAKARQCLCGFGSRCVNPFGFEQRVVPNWCPCLVLTFNSSFSIPKGILCQFVLSFEEDELSWYRPFSLVFSIIVSILFEVLLPATVTSKCRFSLTTGLVHQVSSILASIPSWIWCLDSTTHRNFLTSTGAPV